MNVRSLFLGSAAALISVSVACAADEVSAPDPTEYVKICDAYGSGYFYIPDTETCLRIGGYIRYDIGLGDVRSYDGARTSDLRTGEAQGTWRKNGRFTFKTWTGQETELGALRTYTETRINFGNRNAYSGPENPQKNNAFNSGVTLGSAWMQLGGLRIGKDGPAFDTFIGYAGNVLDNILVPYGDFDANVAQYYFDASNGFSAVVSLEQGSGAVGTIDSHVPHVVVGVKQTQGWGAITGVIARDSNYEALAGKVRVDVQVTDDLSLFGMFGYGSIGNLNDDPTNAVAGHGRGFYKTWGGNWAFWAGATYEFDEKTSFNLQVSGDQLRNSGVAANIAYMVVPGFTVTAEVDYYHYGNFGLGTADPAGVNWTGAGKKNSLAGILRFQSSF
ncbi:MAG: porin [Mesorhizobium sp.]|uniref:porin n=1 Tax=Mesorhizobium sp. TaxID=1871066 RepID=UPI00122B0BDF|nr:porin [Mesorhizobium sp.]TIL84389.1 MAG: porin [Mesorhizobium sp.]TIN47166.1 MAG: porin [Mesorhizobium sp.]